MAQKQNMKKSEFQRKAWWRMLLRIFMVVMTVYGAFCLFMQATKLLHIDNPGAQLWMPLICIGIGMLIYTGVYFLTRSSKASYWKPVTSAFKVTMIAFFIVLSVSATVTYTLSLPARVGWLGTEYLTFLVIVSGIGWGVTEVFYRLPMLVKKP